MFLRVCACVRRGDVNGVYSMQKDDSISSLAPRLRVNGAGLSSG